MVIDKEAGSYDDILILQEIKIDATDDFTDESYSIKQNSLEAKE